MAFSMTSLAERNERFTGPHLDVRNGIRDVLNRAFAGYGPRLLPWVARRHRPE
jgi:hypothetical protein